VRVDFGVWPGEEPGSRRELGVHDEAALLPS
jgi:hypothetical protein